MKPALCAYCDFCDFCVTLNRKRKRRELTVNKLTSICGTEPSELTRILTGSWYMAEMTEEETVNH